MFSPWKKTNKQNDHKIKKKKIREIGTRSGTGSAAVPRGPLGASWSNCNCPGIISLVGAGGGIQHTHLRLLFASQCYGPLPCGEIDNEGG